MTIRLVALREELSINDKGAAQRTLEGLMNDLRTCLDDHPTHGRGWAVVTLWNAYCQVHTAKDAEKFATHYGAAAFLERQRKRIEMDLGLTEDAG